uniref:Dirigent protein n=1 Tax=Zea mays TaxID=4577 RepID=B6TP37_MAIZE|nr:hypothetical protein [Zea mays]
MAGKIEIFTVYQHDRLNETGYVVVTGDEGAPSSDTTRPFGSIYVFRDDLTLHNDSDSPVAGVMEGTSISDELRRAPQPAGGQDLVRHRGYRGSVSVLGGSHNTKPSVYPVVGGTGDFLYTEGYVRSSPVDSDRPRVIYKLEIHLYWPPYTKFAPFP